ncbi:hypothetical protein [Acetobacter sp. DmW_136]|uniref:Uncharacterized protein n=1 Tax=Acetobacter ascendens TaxID=481146 RepID=A0A1Y0V1U1_9PROT|nr:hypothetical protein [Acetobacter sp. DmW_136]ARW11945.1 hypothetical protein S101447_02908 [Acetobacter ascendens]
MGHGTQALVSVFWANPNTMPPSESDTLPDGRSLWLCTVLDRRVEREIIFQYAPRVRPGSGWSYGWSPLLDPPQRWSGKRKADARRRNLRKRLEKTVPLFADQFEEQELRRRPDYFDPDSIDRKQLRK